MIFINWTSPFQNLGLSGVRFYFYSIFDRNLCLKTFHMVCDLGPYCLPMSHLSLVTRKPDFCGCAA